MTLYFSNYLTATCTLTSGYIKWYPDVAFTFSFLDIVFGKYVRWGMGENADTKNVEWVFCRQFLLNKISHRVMFVSWYTRVLSMKSSYRLDNILHFININHICYTIRYDTHIFSTHLQIYQTQWLVWTFAMDFVGHYSPILCICYGPELAFFGHSLTLWVCYV